jgi:hypothetical protein
MTLTKTHILAVASVLLAAIAIYFVFAQTNSAVGESFTGTVSQMDSATTTTVGPQGFDGGNAVVIFTKNSDCDARVITTPGTSAIMLSFDDFKKTANDISSSTLSATVGHLQAASTTVVYDSGQYGCGKVSAYAWATTSLTVSEF